MSTNAFVKIISIFILLVNIVTKNELKPILKTKRKKNSIASLLVLPLLAKLHFLLIKKLTILDTHLDTIVALVINKLSSINVMHIIILNNPRSIIELNTEESVNLISF